nr:MAG TPA: hypothetical protein [Herelleviridae sp.]
MLDSQDFQLLPGAKSQCCEFGDSSGGLFFGAVEETEGGFAGGETEVAGEKGIVDKAQFYRYFLDAVEACEEEAFGVEDDIFSYDVHRFAAASIPASFFVRAWGFGPCAGTSSYFWWREFLPRPPAAGAMNS